MIIGLIAIILIILGLFLIIKGLMIKKNEKVDVKAGGVILIGPFPIVVGDVRLATYMLILALILMIILLTIFFIFIILNI